MQNRKYIKTFESNYIDSILDKISKYGLKAITPLEKKYLDSYYKSHPEELSEIEKIFKGRNEWKQGIYDYDPRKDSEFFKGLGDEMNFKFDFSKYSDEDVENGRLEVMWEQIDDADLEHFCTLFDVTDAQFDDEDFKSWDDLSFETKVKFKKYIDDIYA